MRPRLSTLAIAGLLAAFPTLAAGQRASQPPRQLQSPPPASRPADPEPQAAPAPPAVAAPALPAPEAVPAYAAEIERLAEILGSVHYLRTLCGEADRAAWREDMNALVEAEGPEPQRRQRLVASFNRGYRSLSQTHRKCTPGARLLIDRYVGEGARLARDIVGRYGS